MKLAQRLAAGLALAAPGDLLAGDLGDGERDSWRPAAVLIAVTDRPEPGILLTERRHDLSTHAGQVSYPGGRLDPGETATEAALREAWEEIALDPAEVEVVAEIEPYRTGTGFEVTPVLAAVPPDLELEPNPAEVADLFEVPLAHLLDPANHVRRSIHYQGRERDYFEILWDDRRIWGVTAAILVNLSRRLRWT